MKLSDRFWLTGVLPFAVFAIVLISLASCFPVAEPVPRPTLNEVRSGTARGAIAADTTLRPGEIAAEVAEIDRARREIRVITGDGRRQAIPYDLNATRVIYHGWEYPVESLEAG
ncbi:MAG TPA: hypothetical protein VGK57_04715, partial [Candidatus Binatia bacterium]